MQMNGKVGQEQQAGLILRHICALACYGQDSQNIMQAILFIEWFAVKLFPIIHKKCYG